MYRFSHTAKSSTCACCDPDLLLIKPPRDFSRCKEKINSQRKIILGALAIKPLETLEKE